jgi:cyclopropane fatty-acyl-phospholipid synthase-like methyltransferase
MNITYEVTATIAEAKAQEFERFMRERHIPDVMATGSFTSALFESSSPGRFRARYSSTVESLEEYLAKHAPRLRADMRERFPDRVEFTREEWRVIETY